MWHATETPRAGHAQPGQRNRGQTQAQAQRQRARSWSISSLKNFSVLTSSLIPLRLRVLTMNSRARCCAGDGSSGRRTMDLSIGSPGTICQLSKIVNPNA